MQLVELSIDAGVAHIEMSRPDKMNAVVPQLLLDLEDAVEQIAGNPDVRAAVLSGKGRAFCAGLDTSGFEQMAGEGGHTPVSPRPAESRTKGRLLADAQVEL